MSNCLFVTGTGTCVGKTVVARGLARALVRHGLLVTALKPIETGVEEFAADARGLAQACMQPQVEAPRGFYRARLPVSPYAATLEGEPAPMPAAQMARLVGRVSDGADLIIVEGAGGLLVPLTRDETMADLASALEASLLVVAPNELGVLSHVLTLLESAKQRDLEVHAIMLVDRQLRDDPSMRTNVRILADITRRHVLRLPRIVPDADDDSLGAAVEATGLPAFLLEAFAPPAEVDVDLEQEGDTTS